MIASAFVGTMVLLAATSLGALEFCLGPNMKRFPCVNSRTIWVLRIYTLCLAWAAFDRLGRLGTPDELVATLQQMVASTAMAGAHSVLLIVVLRLRLNEGVWPRLQARWRRVHALNALGPGGAVLARQAAHADAPPLLDLEPPQSMAGALARLADRP